MATLHNSSTAGTSRTALAPAIASRPSNWAIASSRDSSVAVGTRDAAPGPDPRNLVLEIQRLRAQKDKLREQLAERERTLKLREERTIDALAEEEGASSSGTLAGKASSWAPEIEQLWPGILPL